MKLKYGNIPKGRFGADDGIVNVCLGKRYATIAKHLCLAEKLVVGDVAYPRVKGLASATLHDGRTIPVWAVDGRYIRTYTDEEFTNFGQHYRFSFIPKGEFWIDDEAIPDETDFYTAHLVIEYEAMEQGKSYAEAIDLADKVEREMRHKQNGGPLIDPVRKLLDSRKVKLRLLHTTENNVQVWLVDGSLVRSWLHIDFTEGGHDFVYSYVPDNEVWIDNDIGWDERGFVILHEIFERNRMAEGWPYSKAHAAASELEHRMRMNPDELHWKMMAEGWM